MLVVANHRYKKEKGGGQVPKITMEAARVNSKLTQEQIAQKLGISRGYYNNMEKGAVDIKPAYILGFCQITGFKMDDIILPERSTK